MRSTRIILIVASCLLVAALYFLPKVAVENDSQLQTAPDARQKVQASPHNQTPVNVRQDINRLRARYLSRSTEQKNAIFADSLADLYSQAGLFDSSAWFAVQANAFLQNDESLLKAADANYEAYTFAINAEKQSALAEKARSLYEKVLEKDPDNLPAKTRMAMTYLSSKSPMKGIRMLREVLEKDPKNELALFNMGMLSIQSGQFDKAIEWLQKLVSVNAGHLQGQLLLGVAYMNSGDKAKAREQFEKVKKMDSDPSVQATADSYLEELK